VPPPADECAEDAVAWACEADDIEPRDGPKPELIAELRGEVVENCGAGRTSANPDRAT
jgi:hypothetical protein